MNTDAKVVGHGQSPARKTMALSLWLTTLLLLASVTGGFAADTLKLTVQVPFAPNGYSFSINGGNISAMRGSSRQVVNGEGKFTMKLVAEDIYTLALTAANGSGRTINYPVFLANETTTLVLQDSMGNYTVQQGASALAFKKMIGTFGGDFASLNEVYSAYQSAGTNGYNTDSLNLIRDALKAEVQKKVEGFLLQNGNTAVAPFLLYQLWPLKFPVDVYDGWSKQVSSKQMEHPYGQAFMEQFETEKLFGYGQIAPEFAQHTPDGKLVKLSDFRGRFVLIDFWASWCGPCRLENPNLVKAFQIHKQNNFTILGVSLDKDKTKWVDAIKADNLDWTQVSDLGYWQNEVAKQYRIQSIPQNLILDTEGRIIGKNLRGQALDDFLHQLFANKP